MSKDKKTPQEASKLFHNIIKAAEKKDKKVKLKPKNK